MNRLLKMLTAIVFFALPGEVFGQAPTLGSAADFVLFSSVGAVTNTGISHLTGNVGSNSGSSTGFGNVDGVMHDNDGASGICSADLVIAYNQLAAAIPTFFPSSLLGNGDTLLPGIYSIASAATLNGNLILNGQGNANAVFIFKIQGAFAIAAGSKVKLINGAVACNVFWKTEGLVDIASGTSMKGTIVAHNAAINLSANDTLEGRALAIAGAITLNGILGYTPLGCNTPILTGPSAPALLTTAHYGIFSSDGPVTNTGVTHVLGDVGTNLGLTTGFNPLFVTGIIHPIPDGSTAACATDLLTVYTYLNTLPTDIELLYPAQFGNDLVLTPHTYLMNAATTFTGNLYLNAEGNSNAVFVININGALSTSTFSRVILQNGAQAYNVYWNVDGAVDVNDNSFFNGTIIANNGAIHLRTGDTLIGRALSTTGAVTIDAMTVLSSPAPNADTIRGLNSVCVGSSITLTDTASGGVWSASNTHATVLNGLVTGIATGIDTIMYTVTNVTGTNVSSKIITINPAPNAGSISGFSTLCVGENITLTDTIVGGLWSASNTHATILGGIVTGVTTGIDTIRYTVINSCGSDTATKMVTVNPLPNAGSISGLSLVCTGSTLTLTDATTGGNWSSTNFNANVIGGVVTGVVAGLDTIRYIVTNTCGLDTASKLITINPSPNAGTISGISIVCAGSNTTLTDAIVGGLWSANNTHVTVLGGIVTGVTTGIDTIRYTVTNSCGSDTATKMVTINPLPNAGSISGLSLVCTGSTLTLTDATTGGNWSATNFNANIIGGVVTGVVAGLDTIRYIVTNTCGSDTASKLITINPSPNAGIISGISIVCAGSNITLTDAIVGGLWSASNTHATVLGGIVTGVTTGIDTIRYTVTNSCGSDTASKMITVNEVPVLISTTTPSPICDSSLFSYTPLSSVTGTTFAWSRPFVLGIANAAGAGVDNIGEVLYNTTPVNKTVGYIYSLTAGECVAVANISVVIHPTPKMAILTDSICNGIAFTFAPTALTAGTTFTWTRNPVIGVTGGALSGIDVIHDSLSSSLSAPVVIVYSYTLLANNCSFIQQVAITLFPSINVPVITTQSPSSVCSGTMYQNFGTSAAAQSYAPYNWSATNSQVWAQGVNSQYALVNFTQSGNAFVTLTAGIVGTACSNAVTLEVTVGTAISAIPTVTYFFDHFVCTPNDEASYQWGYDDGITLDSTILTGEINQDYVNASPDNTTKSYWVMTSRDGCNQKTYWKTPTAIQNINTDVVDLLVYPNPANDFVNVVIKSTVFASIDVEVMNMLGQKVAAMQSVDNKAAIDVAQLSGGVYIINCFSNGHKIAGTRFTKN